MTIGERLREKRQSMKLTAKELSERSGVPEKTIYRIEKDKNADPKISSLIPLIETLDCSADNLIMDSKNAGLSGMLKYQFEESDKLPIEEKALLIKIISRWVNSVNTEKLYMETLSNGQRSIEEYEKREDDKNFDKVVQDELMGEEHERQEEARKR